MKLNFDQSVLDHALESKIISGDFISSPGYVLDFPFEEYQFIDSTINGLSFSASIFNKCELRNVEFVNCMLDFVHFKNCKFDNVIFKNCSFSHMQFDENCKLSETKIF